MLEHIQFKAPDLLRLLDQRRLPGEIAFLDVVGSAEAAGAIRDMVVRGAPAIGITAAYGLALEAHALRKSPWQEFYESLASAAERLKASRPTAVNLFWAVDHMTSLVKEAAAAGLSPEQAAARMAEEALTIHQNDIDACRSIGIAALPYIPEGARILTHCNAGALATGGYGTALGVVRAAWEAGKYVQVYADETRPYLQGARLTAWELHQDGIPVTVLCDNTAGALMKEKSIDLVVTGADRIAANGDTANKIGTYSVAVLAAHHGLPFYVAAPANTFDLNITSGDGIPIENRAADEVLLMHGRRLAPQGVTALYQAFDVTPAPLIKAIFTERGVVDPVGPDVVRRVLTQG